MVQGVIVPPGGVVVHEATAPLPSLFAVPEGNGPTHAEELVLAQMLNWVLAGKPLPVTWVVVPTGPDVGLSAIDGSPKSAVIVPDAPIVAVVDAEDELAKVMEPEDELQALKAYPVLAVAVIGRDAASSQTEVPDGVVVPPAPGFDAKVI